MATPPARRLLTLPKWVNRQLLFDAAAIAVAALDVWLWEPEGAPWYSPWLSWLGVLAMLVRRRYPFAAVLIAGPGFFVGWAQLAAMIALGTVARRYGVGWQTIVGASVVGLCRFVVWPWADFLELTWRHHVHNALYGVIVTGMPIAIGLLITVRAELSTRIRELAHSREREKRLHAATIRAAERAKLAREMHDVVSHQVTLIAMQAGALRVGAKDEESRAAAETIRALSTRTLEEMRELVGVLRSTEDEDSSQPGLEDIVDLVNDCEVSVSLTIDVSPEQLPAPISRAAYRTVQEALTNVRKHASGARASVRVLECDQSLLIEVRNDAPRTRLAGLPSGGFGLMGLRERATLLGGTFEFGPTSGNGFVVNASYPLTNS